MPMLSAKYAAMISQSTIVSRIGPPIGGMRHDMASGAGPLTASPLHSKLLPDRRIVMDTTQKSVTLTLTERAGEEVKKFLAEEKVSKESAGLRVAVLPGGCSRSEEHTSELQSQFHLVCRLLLEKKKHDVCASFALKEKEDD